MPRIHQLRKDSQRNTQFIDDNFAPKETSRKRTGSIGAFESSYITSEFSMARKNLLFKLANPTVLQKEGIFFLKPINDFFFGVMNYLYLLKETVSVSYKAYRNTYKETPVQRNELPIKDAIEQKLNLGKNC